MKVKNRNQERNARDFFELVSSQFGITISLFSFVYVMVYHIIVHFVIVLFGFVLHNYIYMSII
jgi:hypothetical protein